jgi:hypothetical protein
MKMVSCSSINQCLRSIEMSPSCQASTSHMGVAWLREEDSIKGLEDNTKALGDNIKGLVDNTKGIVAHHILDM